MDLLKKHYEKIILSVVLLGVVIYALLLIHQVDVEREKIKQITKEIERDTPPLPYKPEDWNPLLTVLRKAQTPSKLELSGPHNLFNPVRWRKVGDKVIKEDSVDKIIELFVLTKVTPLSFSVIFDGPRGSDASMRYQFTITDEGAPLPSDRKPKVRTVTPAAEARSRIDARNELKLVEIHGTTANPTEVVVELTGDKERFTVGVGKEKAYRRGSGYEGEAKFDPEKKTFRMLRREISTVQFAGETYKVIAIGESDITIESTSNGRRYLIKLMQTP